MKTNIKDLENYIFNKIDKMDLIQVENCKTD